MQKLCKIIYTTKINIQNCSRCLIAKKARNTDEIADESSTDSNASDSLEGHIAYIKQHKPDPSIQISNGEMLCGNVIIDDSNNNNKISIKQYLSMINDGLNTLLKQCQLYTDAGEIDSTDTITDNLKIVYQTIDKLNNTIKQPDNTDEIINMLKQMKIKIDLNSIQLSELKNTLI